MKRIALVALMMSLPVSALAGSEGWSFIQSVGGLAVEAPRHDARGWVLPVHANLSGVEAISTKPTALKSAVICERADAIVEGRSIYLTIVSGLARPDTTARCPPAALGDISPGKYGVFYRGPGETAVRLGEVSVGL
jgi:hypothetical protein